MRFAAHALGIFLVLLIASNGSAAPDAALSLEVRAGVESVEFGVAFPLTVVRKWQSDLVPEPWDDAVLAPFEVEAIDLDVTSGVEVTEEIRRYRAFAFSLEDVTVPAIALRATSRDGSKELVAHSEPLQVAVRLELDPEAPGAAEIPATREAPEKARSLWPWLLGLLGVGLLIGSLWGRRGTVARPRRGPPLTPSARALARLDRLKGLASDDGIRPEVESLEISALVRDFLEERFEIPAPDMTTEELDAAPAVTEVLGDSHRKSLADLLRRCDLEKWGAPHAPEWERDELLEAATRFVHETEAIS